MRDTLTRIMKDGIAHKVKGGISASETNRAQPRQGDLAGRMYGSSMMYPKNNRCKYLKPASNVQDLAAEIQRVSAHANELALEHGRAKREFTSKRNDVTKAARAVKNEKANVQRMKKKVIAETRNKLDAEDALKAKIDELADLGSGENGLVDTTQFEEFIAEVSSVPICFAAHV